MYKNIIKIPKNIKINNKNNIISFEGPLATIQLNNYINNIKIEDNTNELLIYNNDKAKLGLITSIIKKKIKGIYQGFKIYLYLKGIGFKASLTNNNTINFKLGYSHDILLNIPKDIKVSINKSTTLIIQGTDWEKLTQFAAGIKRLKKTDPYKGKGILFKDEKIIKKEGKKK